MARWAKTGMAAVAVAVLCACGVTIPTDPHGTLERVRGDVLEVGVSVNEPWTSWPTDQDEPEGIEVDLIRDFAEHVDADVRWHRGGEEWLMDMLADEQLEVVIGGLTSTTPWADRAAITAIYTRSTRPDGSEQGQVMATVMGENAFLVELERFLREHEAATP